MPPSNPRLTIKIPGATVRGVVACDVISRVARGAGGVNVGSRVIVGWTLKAAARVGSIVEVTNGVGVGGGSTIRSSPPEMETKEA